MNSTTTTTTTQYFSIYLPAISEEIPESKIRECFKKMGEIHHIDVVTTYNRTDRKDCYVHFLDLYNTNENNEMLKSLEKEDCYQYVCPLDPFEYWNVFKNKSKRYISSLRKKKIQLKNISIKKEEKVKKDSNHMKTNSYFSALMQSEIYLTKKDFRNINEIENVLQREKEIEKDMEAFLDDIDAMEEFVYHQKRNKEYYNYVNNFDKMRLLMTANEGEIMVSNMNH